VNSDVELALNSRSPGGQDNEVGSLSRVEGELHSPLPFGQHQAYNSVVDIHVLPILWRAHHTQGGHDPVTLGPPLVRLLKLNPNSGIIVGKLKSRVEVGQGLGRTSSVVGSLPHPVLDFRIPRRGHSFAHSHLAVLLGEVLEAHPKGTIVSSHEPNSGFQGRGPQRRLVGPITAPFKAWKMRRIRFSRKKREKRKKRKARLTFPRGCEG